MKYDELLKILRECNDCICEKHCPYHEERNNPLKCMTKIVGDAADAIEELQQIAGHYEESAHDYFKDVCYYLERMPKWIPVTERLPELGETVLVCYQWLNPSNKLSVTCDSLHINSTTMKPVWKKHNHSYRVLYWAQLPTLPVPPKDGE